MNQRGLVVAMAAMFGMAGEVGAAENQAHATLMSLSEKDRAAMLALVLKSERCGPVTSTFYQGSDRSGNAMWNARCMRGGAEYQIMVTPTGSTRYLECEVSRRLTGEKCFAKFSK